MIPVVNKKEYCKDVIKTIAGKKTLTLVRLSSAIADDIKLLTLFIGSIIN